MKVRIYQLDPIRANRLAVTRGLLDIIHDVKPRMYNLVHEEDIDFDDPNELCVLFGANTKDPRRGAYHGYPLHINDLVKIFTEDGPVIYQVRVDSDFDDGTLHMLPGKFDLTEARDCRNSICGVLVPPHELAAITRIELTKKSFEDLFGYNYQVLRLPSGECIICSEFALSYGEDASMDAQLNRMIINGSGEPYIAIRGTFFFCEHYDNFWSLRSLTSEKCKQLAHTYHFPEVFYEINGKVNSAKSYPRPCFSN